MQTLTEVACLPLCTANRSCQSAERS